MRGVVSGDICFEFNMGRYKRVVPDVAVVDIYGSATKKPIPKDDEVYFIRDGVASIIGKPDSSPYLQVPR
jgi:hypothetical protein